MSDTMKRTTDFLPQGKTEWTEGPVIPLEMLIPCAIGISNQSFLTIDITGIREYEVDINDPTSSSGWQIASKWPQLPIAKTAVGCSKIGDYVVIAGGSTITGGTATTRSTTTVLDLSTRIFFNAGDMNSPRGFFHMATITKNGKQLILAFGGIADGNVHQLGQNTVEQFHLSNNSWTMAPTTMESPRAQMGAVVVSKQLVCPTQ